MAKSAEDLKIVLPWDVIDSCAGIAFDIGSAVTKAVYLHNDDWVEPGKRAKGSKSCLRTVIFPNGKEDKTLADIKSRVHVMRKSPSDAIDVFTTGIGGTAFGVAIKKQLNVKLTNLTDIDCLVQGVMQLVNTMPRKEIMYELNKPAFEASKKGYEQMKELADKFKEVSSMQLQDVSTTAYSFSQLTTEMTDKMMTVEKDLYPYMVVSVGAGIACCTVNKDGTFQAIDGTTRGGMTLMGLGSLLTKARTYDDLLALCVKGQTSKVSATNVSLTAGVVEKDDKDPYQMFGSDLDEMTVMSFGKAVGKDIGDFKKEDLARGLLETIVLDLVQASHNAAKAKGTNHVFFCGGLINHPLVREMMLEEWLKRDTNLSFISPEIKVCQAHFLKHGQYLGGLGAFLNSKLNFIKQQ